MRIVYISVLMNVSSQYFYIFWKICLQSFYLIMFSCCNFSSMKSVKLSKSCNLELRNVSKISLLINIYIEVINRSIHYTAKKFL